MVRGRAHESDSWPVMGIGAEQKHEGRGKSLILSGPEEITLTTWH